MFLKGLKKTAGLIPPPKPSVNPITRVDAAGATNRIAGTATPFKPGMNHQKGIKPLSGVRANDGT